MDSSANAQFLAAAVEEERAAALDQLTAAWQMHIARLEEVLSSGWKEHLQHVFEERFADLSARLDERFRSELEARLAERVNESLAPSTRAAREQARAEAGEQFSRAVRRLLQSATREEWTAALLDSTSGLCARAALLAVRGQALDGLGATDPEAAARFQGVEIPLAEASAFSAAVESRDPVVSLRTPAELSETVAGLFGDAEADRAHIFPLAGQDKVIAVLYAEGNAAVPVDVHALEALCAVAGAAITARAATSRDSEMAKIAGPQHRPAPGTGSDDWSRLSKEDQDLHLRAQRFARVQIAELRLYKSQAVKAGRAGGDLYGALKNEIDTARESFRIQFIAASPETMVDYLHLELVRTLANDEVALLGSEYPGPLV